MELQPHLVIAGDCVTAVTRLVFLPGAQRLIAGYRDGTIRIWNAKNGKQEGPSMWHNLVGAVGGIGSLVVTSDGTKLVSCVEKSIRMWNVDSQTLVKEWTRLHPYPEVAISPDNRLIAIADRKLTLYHLDGGPEIKHSLRFRGKMIQLGFSPDGHKLACALYSGLYVLDVGNLEGQRVSNPLRHMDSYPKQMLWSFDGRKLFSAWSDGAICYLNPDTGEQIGEARMETRYINTSFLSLSLDGSKLVGWSSNLKSDRSIRSWDAISGDFIGVHPLPANVLCASGELVASAGEDRKICLWRISWSHPVRVESQTRQVFHDRTPSRLVESLSVQMLDDNDLHDSDASEVPSRPDEADLASYPSSACDQYQSKSLSSELGTEAVQLATVMSEQCQVSKLSVKFPPLDLTPYIVKISDRYSAGGGFGDVYRGWYHGGLVPKEVQVAVKAFRFKFTLAGDVDNESLKMIRRELGIWRRLNHINVVPFLGIAYGFGMHDAMSLVSLWMSNDTLQNFLAKHDDNLAVVHRLQFLLNIANGLQYLHSFPIVHGDLNCNNVLLDADYTARLADFGYASLVGNIPEALTYLQRSTTRPGALRWTAPEQIALEDTFSRTTKSDIYSFGCVALQGGPFGTKVEYILIFLQVLSGKRPWSEVREDATIVLRLAMGYKPSRPESHPVDDLHWSLIEHCWASIHERPAAEAIIASIQRFLSYYPPSQPLRNIIPDNSALPGPSMDGSHAIAVSLQVESDYENRLASLPNPSGSVRLRQSDDSSETGFKITTAESYSESPYKRRRV